MVAELNQPVTLFLALLFMALIFKCHRVVALLTEL